MADDQKPPRRRRVPKTPEEYENRLIMKAYSLAEKQIEDGTASAMVTTHFLKLGSQRARMEDSKLKQENLLLEAKTAQIQKDGQQSELLDKAMRAFSEYRGEEDAGPQL